MDWKCLGILLCTFILVLSSGCTDIGDDDDKDGDDGGSNLQLKAEILVVDNSTANLVITHRNGDKIIWSDFQMTLNGSIVTTLSTETSVGETARFTYSGSLTPGEEYTARMIRITHGIVWEDTLVAKRQ